jgi:hypothetical protein
VRWAGHVAHVELRNTQNVLKIFKGKYHFGELDVDRKVKLNASYRYGL